MRKLLIILLALQVIGCSSEPVTVPPQHIVEFGITYDINYPNPREILDKIEELRPQAEIHLTSAAAPIFMIRNLPESDAEVIRKIPGITEVDVYQILAEERDQK